MNDIEKQVNEYLETQGITWIVNYKGERTRDDWKCDAWLFTIGKHEFEYHTGIGHRVLSERDKSLVDRSYPLPRPAGTVYFAGYQAALRAAKKPKAPEPAGLLHSLMFDSSAGHYTFSEWCSDYGYDEDSRKALETYLACQANAVKYNRLFSPEQRTKIEELLQDY